MNIILPNDTARINPHQGTILLMLLKSS